jgi:hypothetical protein
MRQAWLIAMATLAAGCTTTPVPSSSAKPIPLERVYALESTKPEQGMPYWS